MMQPAPEPMASAVCSQTMLSSRRVLRKRHTPSAWLILVAAVLGLLHVQNIGFSVLPGSLRINQLPGRLARCFPRVVLWADLENAVEEVTEKANVTKAAKESTKAT